MTQFLPISAVAERYSTSRFTVYKWLRDDPTFPRPVKMPSGSIRYNLAALEAWEAKRPVAA